MLTPEDWRAILINNLSELIFLAAVAVYGWVVRPIQKRRIEHSKAAIKFVEQLLQLMLADNHAAAIVYAQAQRERSTSYLFFIVALGTYIVSQIYQAALFGATAISIAMHIVTIALAYLGTRYLSQALLYEIAIAIYEKEKGIPIPPVRWYL